MLACLSNRSSRRADQHIGQFQPVRARNTDPGDHASLRTSRTSLPEGILDSWHVESRTPNDQHGRSHSLRYLSMNLGSGTGATGTPLAGSGRRNSR